MTADMRWRNYVLRSGSGAEELWRSLLGGGTRNLLYILGRGFDPRMCVGLEGLLQAGGMGTRDVCVLDFDEGAESASWAHGDLRAANSDRLKAAVVNGKCRFIEREITLTSEDGHRVGGRNIAREFKGAADFKAYTDVFVDISALPRSLYFPLLAKLLTIFERPPEDGITRNLHVVVAHSPSIDSATHDEGIDETATYLHGFSAAELEREATRDKPTIWIPILGRGQFIQLSRIHEFVIPDEICPLLPSPATNPRECDDLMFFEYRELLLDQLRIEPRNIIYASEGNPFEVYRQIMRCVLQYKRALESLSGCKAALSAMSSKLASLGALLAAHDLRHRSAEERVDVGVAHVEAQGYRVDQAARQEAATVYHLWLTGECYAH